MDGGLDMKECVRVAVNVRPLVTPELLVGCTDCVTVVPGEPQVQIGSHSFTFDYVFGSSGSLSNQIYDDCVAPIVHALFRGYNGTVLAYGQTGSGKTYTMGTNYNGEDHSGGVIPKVMETLFSRVEATKNSSEYLIRVSFIEIFKEEVYDLLDPSPPTLSRGDMLSQAKSSGPSRVPIQIRETINGGITLAGVTEAEVRTKEEMASFLLRGSVARATGSTNMNSQSSRSHAIFTISLEQKKIASCPGRSIHADGGDDILIAKLHLVDLAGSERAKRTGADGMRFREGIHINKGLLALGNVISALGDEKKRKEGGHVPYRDSKLTRLLQDSLGGNSKTVMIACVSPADTNAEETLNTLKYANRARNIQNKAVINRDPVAAQMQRMRSQIEELQTELLLFRGDSGGSVEELQILKHKIYLLESSNKELQRELQDRKIECEHLMQRALVAQVEKDKLILQIESSRNGKSWGEIDSNSDQEVDLLKSYVSKIQELEGELLRLHNRYISKETKHSKLVGHLVLDEEALHSELSLGSDEKDDSVEDETEVEVKELEHSSLQEQLDRELKELDKKLEQKEAEMKHYATADTSVLKQHFTKKIHELEQEKKTFQKEIEELKNKLANISSNSDESAQKLKEDYLQRMNTLEAQVAQLKKKQDAQAQLERQKQRSDEAAKRLQDEIHRIKTQKVQLQQKIKQESEQFRMWKASREKEVLQLKKEGRRNEYEMHKLVALNQRQKMVLQRKTEEAAMASKRLKELLDSRKASSREIAGAGNSAATIQALMQAIEHELEVASRVHEVRSEYERQMKERAKMAKELAQLKEEAQNLKQMNLSDSPHTMSPGARSSRQFALENMLSTSSSAIVSMASHLSEAEERERAFTGRGRWNQVRSLVEAKNVMNYLFNLASTSRCQLWDKEVVCREKDMEIRELKEKVVHLVKQVEVQKTALSRQENLHKLSKHGKDNLVESRTSGLKYGEGNLYQLRQTGVRNSLAFSNVGNPSQILEDMDTSDSDDDWVLEDQDAGDDSEWEASRRRQKARKKNSKSDKHSTISNQLSLSSEKESTIEDPKREETIVENQKGICCTCSKSSSCKTMRCECRSSGGCCNTTCGCLPSKCANREQSAHKDDPEISLSLASQGALLLQSALSEKPIEVNGETETRRKALSDIGNTLVKSKPPNPSQRKKWKKSTFQLVHAVPPPQPECTEAQVKLEGQTTETEMHLQLPRSMRATATNNNALKDRNSGHQDEPTVNKESRNSTPTSPRECGIRDEKENTGL